MMAIRHSRVFTGERFSEGPAIVLLDQGKIVGVETGHIELDDGLPRLIDAHVQLLDSEVGALDRVPPDSETMTWTRSSLMDCGGS